MLQRFSEGVGGYVGFSRKFLVRSRGFQEYSKILQGVSVSLRRDFRVFQWRSKEFKGIPTFAYVQMNTLKVKSRKNPQLS